MCISGVSAFEYTSTLTRDDLGVCDTYAEFIGDCLCNTTFSSVLDPDTEIYKIVRVWSEDVLNHGYNDQVQSIDYEIAYKSGNKLKLTFFKDDFGKCVFLHPNVLGDTYFGIDVCQAGWYYYTDFKMPVPVNVKEVTVTVNTRSWYGFLCKNTLDREHIFYLKKDVTIVDHVYDVIVMMFSRYYFADVNDTKVLLVTKWSVEDLTCDGNAKQMYDDTYSVICSGKQTWNDTWCVC
jgi:hypothetical protein